MLYQRSARVEVPSIPRTDANALEVGNYEGSSIIRYTKPHQRSEPTCSPTTQSFDIVQGVLYLCALVKDFIWALTHSTFGEQSYLPSWNGFNMLVCNKVSPVANIKYLPFIRAPPSDFSTIYTTLHKLVEIATCVGQPHILVTADLAIYSKAQQILRSKPEKLDDKVTMRIGGMHLLMAFIAAIWELYGDGGFQDILTSSGVYVHASENLMLQGKHLDRGICGIKLAYEAFVHLFLTADESYARHNKLPWLDTGTAGLISDFNSSFKDCDRQNSSMICDQLGSKVSVVMDTVSKFRVWKGAVCYLCLLGQLS